MPFTHDTELSLSGLAALVNTAPGGSAGDGGGPSDRDGLLDVIALQEHLDHWRWTGLRAGDQAELAEVRALRTRLRTLWDLPERGVVALVNDLLREASALPQLVCHDGYDYHVHATAPQAPLADRMAVEFAMAMVDVVRAKGLDRLRICAAPGCHRVMVDLSKNRSRRFCDTTCSNRVNVAAFRARHAPGAR